MICINDMLGLVLFDVLRVMVYWLWWKWREPRVETEREGWI